MGKPRNLAPLAAILSALAAAGVFIAARLEVYERSVILPPSREAEANQYLAMERWLGGTGRPVRALAAGKAASLARGSEKVVFLHASSFDWRKARETLEPWAASGGVLVAALDTPWYKEEDPELTAFLRSFGLGRRNPGRDSDIKDETPYEGPDEAGRAGYADARFSVAEADGAFDKNVVFSVQSTEVPGSVGRAALYVDSEGQIRLITLYLGAGSITVTGIPYFMHSGELESGNNARLAWELLGKPAEAGGGVLFIRPKKQAQSLWGKLAGRGNPVPLGVSCAALLIIGFWAVIPVFGFLLDEPAEPGASIRERFRSEARFLRKHRALGAYIAVYHEEINRRLRARDALGLGRDEACGEPERPLPRQHLSARSFLKEARRLSKICPLRSRRLF